MNASKATRFMLPKFARVLLIVSISLLTFSGVASALSVEWYDVKLTVQGESKQYKTTAESVGKFLQEQKIVFGKYDYSVPSEDTRLVPNQLNVININSRFDATVKINGRKELISVEAGTSVRELIAILEQERKTSYTYAGNLDTIITVDKDVALRITRTEFDTTNLPLMYETEFIPDPTLELGVEKVVQAGVPGELVVVTKVTYKDDEIIKTELISETISKEPVTEKVKRGTKETLPVVIASTSELPTNYVEVITMNASAYSADYECTGKKPGHPLYGITASGLPVEPGIVAVDPSVIPLGTKLYVEGYGEALAADTGSAIVGNKIDLYYESLEVARAFGRKELKVYILASK